MYVHVLCVHVRMLSWLCDTDDECCVCGVLYRRNAEHAQRVAEKRRIEEEKKLMQRKKPQVCTCTCIHVYVSYDYFILQMQENEHEEILKKQKQLKENKRKRQSKKHNDVSDIPYILSEPRP